MNHFGIWLPNFMFIGLITIPFALSQDSDYRTIQISGKDIILNGSMSLRIVSGEIHYFRTPAAYWEDILTKLKLAGLNAVSTYVEWSFHEPEERQYDFSGDRDLAKFIRTAAEVGLYVLLRPGPYIGAERDLGGFPYWLLRKYSEIMLRSLDTDFISETNTWFKKLFEQLSPLLYGNGGPIILVQVENEFRSYGNDEMYITTLANSMRNYIKDKALLYTADRPFSIQMDFLTNTSFAAVIFGPTSYITVSEAFKELNISKGGPLMNAKLYTGWFSRWGQPLARVDTDAVVKTLTECLDSGVHVNLYMFFGGTNFGFTSGASVSMRNGRSAFTPLLTSYDYDAPLDEGGEPTKKYFAIRKVIEKYVPEVQSLPLPEATRRGSYGKVEMEPTLGLLSEEGRAMLATNRTTYSGAQLPTFEDLRQRSGLVLYELTITSIPIKKNVLRMITAQYRRNNVVSNLLNDINTLYINDPRDSIYVFVDGNKTGYITRMNSSHHTTFPNKNIFTLSLLVENQGRRHNMKPDDDNRKGIIDNVNFNIGKLIGNWNVTGFNLETLNVSALKDYKTNNSASLHTTLGPVLYTGTLKLLQTPRNTFLNTEGWGKGVAWINGHNLGRYWPAVGPQLTLFVPGVWLNTDPEINVIHMLELERPSMKLTIDLVADPLYGISIPLRKRKFRKASNS